MHARYRIESTIGRGGMGTVARAYDRLTNTWVALKQLSLEPEVDLGLAATRGAGLRLALADEFRTLATLRHPHIVSVLDYGFGHDAAFFTMEYLDKGLPLTKAAETQPVVAQLQWLGQLLQALEYLRRHRVVHRDLKPANVLVQAGQVKVLDFGLAVLEGQYGLSAGSLLYMAPEALQNQPLTHASDLFAVGVIAYRMLTGHRPFEGSTPEALLTRIYSTSPNLQRVRGPETLRAVLARLLAPALATRYATAAEVLADLAAASGELLPLETQATRASFIQAAQFVGRTAELQQLTAALSQAQQGQGSVWWLGGENGVGKSRLLEELRVQALVRGVWVWAGQAVSESGVPAQIWSQILCWLALTAEINDLEAGVLKPYVPQLEGLLQRTVPDVPALEPKIAQERFYGVVLTLLRQVAAQHPLLLILEDLHWVRPLSRALLAWVMRAVGELPVLIVATYRDDEQPRLPAEFPAANELTLKRLEMTEVAALTSAIVGQAPTQLTRLTQFLYQQTEGNTLFVVEVLRSLAEEAGLLSQVQTLTLPENLVVGSIQQVLQRRLQRIRPPDYGWLELAAVAGRDLDLPLLQHLGPTQDWAAWLNRCAEAAVLEPQGLAWRFAHDQLRQALLANMSLAQQRALHLQLAEGLEQVYASQLVPHLQRLVYHYTHTDQVAQQRHYLTQAAQLAQAAYDLANALSYYQQLLPLLTEPAAQQACYLERGTVLEVLGQWAAAEQDYRTALQLAEQVADAAGRVQAMHALGRLFRGRGAYDDALAWLEKAHAEAATGPILVELGAVFLRKGAYPVAQQHLEAGLALAQAANDQPAVALALGYLGSVARSLGNYDLAQMRHDASLTISRALGDKRGVGISLNNLGLIALDHGRHLAAQTLFAESLTLRREIADKGGIALSLSNLGAAACYLGNYAAADAYFLESLDLRRAIGDKWGIAMALNNLGLVAAHQGDFATAQQRQTEGLALAREIGAKRSIGVALTNLGYTTLQLGNYAQSRAYYAESLQLMHAIGDKLYITYNWVGLAGVELQIGLDEGLVSEATVRYVAHLVGAANALREAINGTWETFEQQLHDYTAAIAQAILGKNTWPLAYAVGAAMPLDATVAYALAGVGETADDG